MRGQKCRFRPFGLLSPFGSDETLELPQHAREGKMPFDALAGREVLRETAFENFEAGLRKRLRNTRRNEAAGFAHDPAGLTYVGGYDGHGAGQRPSDDLWETFADGRTIQRKCHRRRLVR